MAFPSFLFFISTPLDIHSESFVVVFVKSLSHVGLFCDPVDCSLPGFSVHGILQARMVQWVAISSSRGSSDPGIKPEPLTSPALAGGIFTTSATGKPP